MAREEVRVSLFPFMSVLACTIGGLILLLATLSLSAVAPSADDASPATVAEGGASSAGPASADDAKRVASSAAPDAEDAQADPTPLERDERSPLARAERPALERVEALLERVDRALRAGGEKEVASLTALEARLARNRRRDREQKALAGEATALATSRETIEAEIEALESRRETLPILIDPTGLSRHLEPWFIECDARGGLLLRARDDLRFFVPRDELSLSQDFGRYLRRLRAQPDALLVLLVRPDGLKTKDVVERVARQAGVRVASLPLPGRGELDWSLLRRAESAGEQNAAPTREGAS